MNANIDSPAVPTLREAVSPGVFGGRLSVDTAVSVAAAMFVLLTVFSGFQAISLRRQKKRTKSLYGTLKLAVDTLYKLKEKDEQRREQLVQVQKLVDKKIKRQRKPKASVVGRKPPVRSCAVGRKRRGGLQPKGGPAQGLTAKGTQLKIVSGFKGSSRERRVAKEAKPNLSNATDRLIEEAPLLASREEEVHAAGRVADELLAESLHPRGALRAKEASRSSERKASPLSRAHAGKSDPAQERDSAFFYTPVSHLAAPTNQRPSGKGVSHSQFAPTPLPRYHHQPHQQEQAALCSALHAQNLSLIDGLYAPEDDDLTQD
eukprot:GHVT01001424.1.p1 GENE.GHVT01001424.1~~GHVT01001424.1.p1  ORF type:complete len:318 (+),score=71.99 GHVT01001424.1:743-1696(+)